MKGKLITLMFALSLGAHSQILDVDVDQEIYNKELKYQAIHLNNKTLKLINTHLDVMGNITGIGEIIVDGNSLIWINGKKAVPIRIRGKQSPEPVTNLTNYNRTIANIITWEWEDDKNSILRLHSKSKIYQVAIEGRGISKTFYVNNDLISLHNLPRGLVYTLFVSRLNDTTVIFEIKR